jgi:hypothetical protein
LDANGLPLFDPNNLVWTEVPPEELGDCPFIPGTQMYDYTYRKPPFQGPFANGRHNDHFLQAYEPLQSELSYWKIFFPEDPVINNWVQWTNVYGRIYVGGYKDTTNMEFKAFIGILKQLGLTKYCRKVDAWDHVHGDQWIRSMMNYERFKMILGAWHYIDTSTYNMMNEEQKENY